jgi:hypothetical protein
MARAARIRYTLVPALGVAIVAGAMIFFAPVAVADPSTPGGTLALMPATVTDSSSKTTYSFALRADEDPPTPGVGSVVMVLGGPAVSLCTVRMTGPLAVDFSTAPESGSFPYQHVQCGRAFAQTVAIDGCVATIKAHGFLHSDDPNSNVLDGMTIALRFQRTGPSSGNFDATISTVAKRVEIHGKATSGAPIIMPTCP